jgi:hypothetical protein
MWHAPRTYRRVRGVGPRHLICCKVVTVFTVPTAWSDFVVALARTDQEGAHPNSMCVPTASAPTTSCMRANRPRPQSGSCRNPRSDSLALDCSVFADCGAPDQPLWCLPPWGSKRDVSAAILLSACNARLPAPPPKMPAAQRMRVYLPTCGFAAWCCSTPDAVTHAAPLLFRPAVAAPRQVFVLDKSSGAPASAVVRVACAAVASGRGVPRSEFHLVRNAA